MKIFIVFTRSRQERSTGLSRKRARISKSKYWILPKGSSLDSKESWKIRTPKYQIVRNQLLRIAPKIPLAIYL